MAFANQVILKSYVDEEGFDADGIGDYTFVDERYQSFNSLEEVLTYLTTIKEYCDAFGFEIYERKIL